MAHGRCVEAYDGVLGSGDMCLVVLCAPGKRWCGLTGHQDGPFVPSGGKGMDEGPFYWLVYRRMMKSTCPEA